jgi:heme/copper-type cytochrome/quinol oxidase subunit 2
MPTMMRDAAISFPLLGDWSIDPSASFTLFGRTFYWYGVIIAVGFILAMLYCARHCRRCGIEPDTLYDFLIWMIPIAIIGARCTMSYSSGATTAPTPSTRSRSGRAGSPSTAASSRDC